MEKYSKQSFLYLIFVLSCISNQNVYLLFNRGELISLGDIENIYKKKKTTKEERILSVRVNKLCILSF